MGRTKSEVVHQTHQKHCAGLGERVHVWEDVSLEQLAWQPLVPGVCGLPSSSDRSWLLLLHRLDLPLAILVTRGLAWTGRPWQTSTWHVL